MLGFLPPPALSPEGRSTIPDVRKTPSALVHKSPSPRLNPSPAAVCLQGLQTRWNHETLCCTTARLHCSVKMCSHSSTFSLLHLWTFCFVIGGEVRLFSKALCLQNSFQSIIGRILWQESTSQMQPVPLAGLIFTMILLCMSTGRLLAFIRKCWNASVELVRLMRLIFTVEIHSDALLISLPGAENRWQGRRH